MKEKCENIDAVNLNCAPKDNAAITLTLKDYAALCIALFSIILPWGLLTGGVFALLIFLLTKFWIR